MRVVGSQEWYQKSESVLEQLQFVRIFGKGFPQAYGSLGYSGVWMSGVGGQSRWHIHRGTHCPGRSPRGLDPIHRGRWRCGHRVGLRDPPAQPGHEDHCPQSRGLPSQRSPQWCFLRVEVYPVRGVLGGVRSRVRGVIWPGRGGIMGVVVPTVVIAAVLPRGRWDSVLVIIVRLQLAFSSGLYL